jgi:Diadenosine tetraphosphate (Ap4A) hydrolase and other HIT family hydrolases
MSSIFTRIINGEIPGHFVWRDSECVAFMDIQPISRGHLLVVPRQETDRWHDLPPQTAAHLFAVAHKIAAALDQLSERSRVGLMIAGFDVPHTHIHLMPADSMAQFDPKNADKNARPEDLDTMAGKIRDALRALGHGANVPED